MNRIHRALLVASALAMASVASAQTTGTTTTGTGNASNASGNGGTNQAGTGTQTLQLAEAPSITSTASGGITRGNSDSSNLLGGYYANPLYQGARSVSGTLTNVVAPGGFGSSTFTTGGSASVGGSGGNATSARGGATAGRTGGSTTGTLAGGTTLGGSTLGGNTAGRQAGGLGGGAQGGGIGGASNSQNSNQQLSTGRSIAYTQSLKFGVPPMTMTQIQTEVVNMLATSSVAGANQVQATAGEFGTVILSGRVADEDSAKLIEGMVMLTPGVKQVKNDITYPKP